MTFIAVYLPLFPSRSSSQSSSSSSPSRKINYIVRRNQKKTERIKGEATQPSIMTMLDPVTTPAPVHNTTCLESPLSPCLAPPSEHSLSFFPPFEPSPEHWEDSNQSSLPSMLTTMLAPLPKQTAWVRPTSCNIPNPPRKRHIPIDFASSSFKALKPVSSPVIPPYSHTRPPIKDDNLIEIDRALGVTDVPPAPVLQPWVRPTACPHPNHPRKRLAPIYFASTTFNSSRTKPKALQHANDAPALPSISPNTEKGKYNDAAKVPHPPRRRTEPILFAATKWQLPAAPSSPPELSPISLTPTGNLAHDWSKIHVVDVGGMGAPPAAPSRKWMDLPLYESPVRTHIDLPDASRGAGYKTSHHHRVDSTDSDQTIRPSQRAAAIVGQPGLAPLAVTHSVQPDDSEALSVSRPMSPTPERMVPLEDSVDSMRPRLNRFLRPVSPTLPEEDAPVGSGLYDTSKKPTSTSDTAQGALAKVWVKDIEQVANGPDKQCDTKNQGKEKRCVPNDVDKSKLVPTLTSTPRRRIILRVPNNHSPKSPSPRSRRPLLRRHSAHSSLRDIFSPPVPPSSPTSPTFPASPSNILSPERGFPTLSPRSVVDSDPFDEWIPTVRKKDIFDVEAVSMRLRAVAGRVNFDEVEGLGEPGE